MGNSKLKVVTPLRVYGTVTKKVCHNNNIIYLKLQIITTEHYYYNY